VRPQLDSLDSIDLPDDIVSSRTASTAGVRLHSEHWSDLAGRQRLFKKKMKKLTAWNRGPSVVSGNFNPTQTEKVK
jgi:hypothetical protein